MSRVALYDHPVFREHDAGAGHAERAERLEALRHGLREADLERKLDLLEPRPASREQLLRVHTAAHVESVAATEGLVHRFDPDTLASPRSYAAALLAAGAVVDAVNLVLDGGAQRAFCAVRPPGHHAESERVMGFCLFNSVAVAAAHALARGLERVLIIDFDVHHGNGTQEIFYADRRVLYISSHEHPLYPGTGGVSEIGAGDGRGFNVNLPMPTGSGDAEYAAVYREIVAPIGRSFEPQLVLVSAGFDPHAQDPLAGMQMTEAGFAAVAQACLTTAEGARGIVFALEGGYALGAIAASGAAVMRELLEEGGAPEESPATPLAAALVGRYRKAIGPLWPILRA